MTNQTTEKGIIMIHIILLQRNQQLYIIYSHLFIVIHYVLCEASKVFIGGQWNIELKKQTINDRDNPRFILLHK